MSEYRSNTRSKLCGRNGKGFGPIVLLLDSSASTRSTTRRNNSSGSFSRKAFKSEQSPSETAASKAILYCGNNIDQHLQMRSCTLTSMFCCLRPNLADF
eukprot:1040188-Amphidinium_carterae.1